MASGSPIAAGPAAKYRSIVFSNWLIVIAFRVYQLAMRRS
jgi:hypothetical protein